MIANLISSILSLAFKLIITILDYIFSLFNFLVLPGFSEYSSYIVYFWDACFEFIGYIRSAFLIGSFEMNIIYTILFIKLTYKPMIALVKLFIHLYDKLKI